MGNNIDLEEDEALFRKIMEQDIVENSAMLLGLINKITFSIGKRNNYTCLQQTLKSFFKFSSFSLE